jgi:FkbM family methyltransferase
MNVPWRMILPGIAGEWIDAHRAGVGIPQWRSATRAGLDLLPSLEILRNGTVLDVGANVGDWTAAVLAAEPSTTVIAVEPNEAPLAALVGRFAHDSRVTVRPLALGATSGTQTFHITEHRHNSSLKPPRPDMDQLYHGGGWRSDTSVELEVSTVDELCAGRDIALLKIDVQGAEREVLAGAGSTLPRTRAILLEVTFLSHYEGDTTFPALHEYMLGHGFELANLSRPFMSTRRTALWCDACYTRQPV